MVVLYGKDDCPNCILAKQILTKESIDFQVVRAADFLEYHDGWREDGSVELLALYSDVEELPIIKIEEKFMEHKAALAKLGCNTEPVRCAAAACSI